jgi:hypothetical protein
MFGHSAEARYLPTRIAIARGYAKLNFTIRCVIQAPEEKAEEGCETGFHNYVGDGEISIRPGRILTRIAVRDNRCVAHPVSVTAEELSMPDMASPQMAVEPVQGLHLSCPPDWFLTRDAVRDNRRVAHPVSVVAEELPMPDMASP